jgi:hypothetical protein
MFHSVSPIHPWCSLLLAVVAMSSLRYFEIELKKSSKTIDDKLILFISFCLSSPFDFLVLDFGAFAGAFFACSQP